jgi:hypothetical protein
VLYTPPAAASAFSAASASTGVLEQSLSSLSAAILQAPAIGAGSASATAATVSAVAAGAGVGSALLYAAIQRTTEVKSTSIELLLIELFFIFLLCLRSS